MDWSLKRRGMRAALETLFLALVSTAAAVLIGSALAKIVELAL